MNTASPRIPSPLDTAGMMAVASAPGLAGQGTAQRGLAGGVGGGASLENEVFQDAPGSKEAGRNKYADYFIARQASVNSHSEPPLPWLPRIAFNSSLAPGISA